MPAVFYYLVVLLVRFVIFVEIVALGGLDGATVLVFCLLIKISTKLLPYFWGKKHIEEFKGWLAMPLVQSSYQHPHLALVRYYLDKVCTLNIL